MKELASSATRTLLLVLLAIGGVTVALRAWGSVTNYRSPYALEGNLPAGTPLVERVVLVVLDGLRADVAQRMPALQDLARRGSSGILRAGLPSLSNPSRAVMATGAWQEINGVTNNSRFAPPPVSSLFSEARRTSLPVAIAGSYFWRQAFGEYLDPDRLAVHEKGPSVGATANELIDWQEKACGSDLEFIRKYQQGLLIIGVTASDSAGHDFGGLSQEYQQVARAVDACIGSIVNSLDDGRTTIIVTSDHGHIDLRGHGGHGGDEEEVTRVPLVLAGKSVAHGNGWQAEQVDITPTICALLGLPLPATSQGHVLWNALEVPAPVQIELHSREAQQQALAASRLPDPEKVRAIEKRNRSIKALVVFTCLWFIGCGIILGHRDTWRWLLIAGAIYYAVYFVLFYALGMQYSLSAVNRQEYLTRFFSKDLGAAAVAFWVSSVFLLRRSKSADARTVLDFALLVGCTLCIQATWVYYAYGLFMHSVMLNLREGFKAYLDLLQLPAIAVAASAVALLSWLANREPAATMTEKSDSAPPEILPPVTDLEEVRSRK